MTIHTDEIMGTSAAARIVDHEQLTIDYLATALWSSTVSIEIGSQTGDRAGLTADDSGTGDVDEGWAELQADDVFDTDDATDETVQNAREELISILAAAPLDVFDHWTPDGFAHDFWLTRNGHGAGFWDRYYGDTRGAEVGKILTDLARTYGTADVVDMGDGRFTIE